MTACPRRCEASGACSLELAALGSMSKTEVAEHLGISQQRVTMIEITALVKLRQNVRRYKWPTPEWTTPTQTLGERIEDENDER